MEAGRLLKSKWDATWPCDRFAYELVTYERELARNKALLDRLNYLGVVELVQCRSSLINECGLAR
jgi:hypothetical protein